MRASLIEWRPDRTPPAWVKYRPAVAEVLRSCNMSFMISWQAMTLNGILRFTMKRRGKKPIDLRRLRDATDNPSRFSLVVPTGHIVETLRTDEGLEFDVVDTLEKSTATPAVVVLYLHGGGYIFG